MFWRDLKNVGDLKRGDVITHKHSGNAYVVTSTEPGKATAVKTIDVRNAREWQVYLEPPA